ncbi:DUF4129 domain-containing protein [Haloterrigena sp. SYSU A558-1]|uniref:DUF4129 domain-containing protein n=1 Tax=Haloterrigena gelatinilytica TaxID=2741724 RepID=A0ABX2L6E7_9EURY|nr:DUF4129 domain-containing protein [Haloterrigena gelatinilytica]NUC71844.1 DUF4129 domain-containing protein [Haloterrigena gelatinilytica]
MDRDTGRVVAIAVLCCLAVVLAAATLPSMVENGGSGGGFGGGDGGASDVEEQGEPPAADSGAGGGEAFEFTELCVAFLDSELGFLALVLGAVGIAALATRSYDTKITLMLSVALLPLVVLVFVVLTGGCGTQTLEPPAPPADIQPPAENESGGPLGGGDGDGSVSGPTLPSLLVLTVLLVTVVGAFAALFYSGDDEGRESADPVAEPDDTVQRGELGRAAGEAADRIEAGDDFENDVYRAWREMTEPLSVDRPDSSTPGEFAAAARDAGLDPSHVDELRTMFEDVRYGDRSVTDDRERRAVELLRRIEATYADDDRDRENGATR